jgi:hypothetical protein
LERELNVRVQQVASMSEAEYEEFRRLESLRNTIADSSDSFLSIGSVARIFGAAALSTITVVGTAVMQIYLERTL